ncbi:hypothetical protein CEXT_253851 [Caerostris extrusa]|uniref:Uncharacterized protein n=1 Tax=Caerostris extrusa TaxID=172846 RepID=A0AAV4XC40_CAEEX|nr:hypothetical protein CEXT_253851 [Caerostris extrusa]
MRISIRLHPRRSETDSTSRKMHAGNRSMGRLISDLSRKQAARESSWLDAITRRKLGFPWVLGVIREDGLRDYYFRMERCFT